MPAGLPTRAGDFRLQQIAQIYTAYDKRLREANALDFDDIILHTVRLLQQDEEVRTYYQKKFRYVLIDEYQDTNNLQYLLASLLAGGHENICVVGDDDQSIYRFRGANHREHPELRGASTKGCRTIRLEQNYRSTKNILDGGQRRHPPQSGPEGQGRCGPTGAPATRCSSTPPCNESDEASFVADTILSDYREGRKLERPRQSSTG